MRTAVVGDIGGWGRVFDRVIDYFEVENGIIPRELKIIQVGDLIRCNPQYRESNLRLIDRAEELIQKNPGRYVQLIGNHESVALGSPAPKHYDLSSYSEEIKSRIKELWQAKAIKLADSIPANPITGKPAVVTHAGLSKDLWQAYYESRLAVDDLAEIINEDRGREYRTWGEPGKLVYGVPDEFADVTWALTPEEVIPSWLNHEYHIPFAQIYGHAAIYSYAKNCFYPNIPDELKRFITVDNRTCRIRAENGLDFICTDWTLGDEREITGELPKLYVF